MNKRLLQKNNKKRKIYFEEELNILSYKLVKTFNINQSISTFFKSSLPSNISSLSSIENRCNKTGNGRAILSTFGYSRHFIKYLAETGKMPGISRYYK